MVECDVFCNENQYSGHSLLQIDSLIIISINHHCKKFKERLKIIELFLFTGKNEEQPADNKTEASGESLEESY